MNTDHDLEKRLGRLSPAPPGPELMARLRAARPAAAAKKPLPFPRLWLPLAAAAGLAFAWLGRNPPPAPPTAAERPGPLHPVSSIQHLMEIDDLGIIVGSDDRPVRLIRTRWIDEIHYAPSGGGESVKEGRLREEVLPVSVELY